MGNQSIYKQQELFKTPRLIISDVSSMYEEKSDLKADLLTRTITLLSPKVVKALPPHFQAVSSLESADYFINRMLVESQCLAIKLSENKLIIGFLFLYQSTDNTTHMNVHIGYLLGEDYWGQGYAKEFLNGLISWSREKKEISTLVAGVEPNNIASACLLTKMGFSECSDKDSTVVLYEYELI